MKNLTEKQMYKIIKLNNKIADCYNKLANAQAELWEIEKDLTDGYWRNIKIDYWKDICEKYQEEKLINCYGDVFYIDEKYNNEYVGRRVLWNLGLSDEKYEIQEIIENDSYCNSDYIDYKINIKEN